MTHAEFEKITGIDLDKIEDEKLLVKCPTTGGYCAKHSGLVKKMDCAGYDTNSAGCAYEL